jgi:hypothetical protein
MVPVEPIIAVLGPRYGGTSAVAGVLHHLGVFMGSEFHWTYREPHETWEEYRLSRLCGHAFGPPGNQLRIDRGRFEAKLRDWADEHRRAARIAGHGPAPRTRCCASRWIRSVPHEARWCRSSWIDQPRKSWRRSTGGAGWPTSGSGSSPQRI